MSQSDTISAALAHIDGELRQNLLSALSDIIVKLDAGGRIESFQCQSTALQKAWVDLWPGQLWQETVTEDSLAKIGEMLSPQVAPSIGRQVNHPLPGLSDVPVTYATIRLVSGGWLAFGRDMRAISDMQQQLVQFQIAKERDYARIRAFETRFRILAETINQPVFVIDTSTQIISDHNRAAKELLSPKTRRQLSGRILPDLLPAEQARSIIDVLAQARNSGQPQQTEIDLGGVKFDMNASPFRQEGANLQIVRMTRADKNGGQLNGKGVSGLAWSGTSATFDRMPDGIVTTDMEGVILIANEAFVELSELSGVEQVIGANLSRWLGRPGVDLGVLLTQLRTHGRVKSYNTTLSGNYGTIAQIEVTAAADTESQHGRATFMIRDMGNRPRDPLKLDEALPHSATELTQLVGRVPLKELVRQTTDVIERLCIESALELTNENRASAAELLGLSRQGLYVKLRRYGIIDDPAEQ